MTPLGIIAWAIALVVLLAGTAIAVGLVRYTIDEAKGRHPRGVVVTNTRTSTGDGPMWGVLNEPGQT
jgi:hypothetical protein